MRVQVFAGKLSVESLRQMSDHINRWLEDEQVEPKFIKQSFGYGQHHEVSSQEPFLVISVWY